jgi:hypothetical protein
MTTQTDREPEGAAHLPNDLSFQYAYAIPAASSPGDPKALKCGLPAFLLMLAVHQAFAGTPAETVGFYHWGGEYPVSGSAGVEKIAGLGSHAARIALSPKYNMEYNQGTACSTAGSLEALAQEPDIQAAFDNPHVDVFMITAYDFTTYGDCQTQQFLEPGFYTTANTQTLVQEYSDFTLYLYRTYAHSGKRFIISNWEGDNEIYCGAAYAYATSESFRESCNQGYSSEYYGNPTPAESFEALKLWFQFRQQGIADGRLRAAQEGLTDTLVYFAPEFCITRALHEGGFESVLYDVLPSVLFDYVSYSAYESINTSQPAETLTEDLNTIEKVTGSKSIILGEIGFARSVWGAATTVRIGEVLAAADAWGVPYIFVWNLYDTSATEDYGAYSTDGLPTPLAGYYWKVLAPSADNGSGQSTGLVVRPE